MIVRIPFRAKLPRLPIPLRALRGDAPVSTGAAMCLLGSRRADAELGDRRSAAGCREFGADERVFGALHPSAPRSATGQRAQNVGPVRLVLEMARLQAIGESDSASVEGGEAHGGLAGSLK